MKYKYMFAVVLGSISFLGLGTLAYAQTPASQAKVSLSLETSKRIYKMGETVSLTFQLKNERSEVLSIADRFGVGGGLLSVYTAEDGKNFEKYTHPGWGLVDYINPVMTIKPGESVLSSATVLWKWRGSEKSEYVFPNAGSYFLKARYVYDHVIVDGQLTPVVAESKPVKITVEEPIGEDLEVWNTIKADGGFAYFIQEGDVPIPDYKADERLKFQQGIDQLLVDHPNSFYAASLRRSMEKFRASEARRIEALRKLRKQAQ